MQYLFVIITISFIYFFIVYNNIKNRIYRKEFEKLGINIDEPGNVVWRSKENHRQNNNKLTKEQAVEFRNKTEQKNSKMHGVQSFGVCVIRDKK